MIPDLAVVLLEENPIPIPTDVALDGMSIDDLRDLGKSLNLEARKWDRDTLIQRIKEVEGDIPLTYASQRLPELDLSWPFFYKEDIYIISRSHVSNPWLAKLATIPQAITNFAFTTWLGQDPKIRSPEEWGEGEEIIPVVLPFEARKGDLFDFKKWRDYYPKFKEAYVDKLESLSADDLINISVKGQCDFVMSPFPHHTELAKEVRGMPMQKIEIILGEYLEGLPDNNTSIKNAYFLHHVIDPRDLAEYAYKCLWDIAGDVNMILGDGLKAFKFGKKLDDDFGLMVAMQKLAYPSGSDDQHFDANFLISGYRRFDRDLSPFFSSVKRVPKQLSEIKSVYPAQKQKKKIKFSL
jgi:hypothetical protein